jgi:hypothetical protein
VVASYEVVDDRVDKDRDMGSPVATQLVALELLLLILAPMLVPSRQVLYPPQEYQWFRLHPQL